MFTWAYDALDRVTVMLDPGYGATAGGRTTWSFDPRGQISRRDNANGTRTTSAYDPDGRVLQLWHSQSDGTEIEHAFYAYDPVGNSSYKATKNDRATYSYDLVDQLTGEERAAGRYTWGYDFARRRETQRDPSGISGYEYDRADQLLSVTRPAGEQAQQHWITLGAYPFLYQHPWWRGQRFPLPISGATTFGYDPNGNRVSAQDSGGTTSYTWDTQDRLTEILLASGARVTNTYRHDGLRHSRTDAGGVSTMVWDPPSGGQVGADVLFEEGANAQAFMRGPELARAVGAGVNRFYHADAMQTAQAITDASGATETTYVLDAWGNLVSGAASGNPYVYHGGLGYWQEPDLGLSYVRARWLEPGTGSWLSVDPVTGEPRYSYARNMPTTRVDPTGRRPSGPVTWLRAGVFNRDTLAGLQGALGGIVRDFQDPRLLMKDLQHSLKLADTLLENLKRAVGNAIRKSADSVPRWLRKLAPPPLEEQVQQREYWEGLGLGVLGSLGTLMATIAGGFLVSLASALIPLVAAIGSFAWHVLTEGFSLGSLVSYFLEPIKPELEKLADAPTLSPFNRGLTAGNLVIGLLALIVLVALGVKGGVELIARLKTEGAAAVFSDFAAKAAAELQRTRSNIASVRAKAQELVASIRAKGRAALENVSPGLRAAWATIQEMFEQRSFDVRSSKGRFERHLARLARTTAESAIEEIEARLGLPKGVFQRSVDWTATSPRGTGQTYEVIERNDINWGRIRTGGDRRGIGLTNAEAAQLHGLAPELDDGFFATLHHLGQDSRGPLVEASTRYHGVGQYGQDILHSQFGRSQPNPLFPIDRVRFGYDTREYWIWRATHR